jgi:predicted nucleotidyltransferase component of viral defense system
MIPASDITKWGVTHPWPTREQIEQDLLLSQAICGIANDQLLGTELVIRGGTAFHKLFLPEPFRYSEDLDYVRSSGGGIGEILSRLSHLGEELGYKVNSQIARFPKVFWRGVAESGLPLKIKIEINTYERSPALPLITKRHSIDVGYCSTHAGVRAFQAETVLPRSTFLCGSTVSFCYYQSSLFTIHPPLSSREPRAKRSGTS